MTSDSPSCEDYVNNLVNSVEDNCRHVEEMAMLEINARHIPLINSTLCLTNIDCHIILDMFGKHHYHNVWETSLLLITLTDFISCVSANYEIFPMGNHQKNTAKITRLLQILKHNWQKLFVKLSPADMNISQMTGIANSVKRCLERIPPESTYKRYMETISKMTQEALHKLVNPKKIRDKHNKKNKIKIKKSGGITSSKTYDISIPAESTQTVFEVLGNKLLKQRKENKGKMKKNDKTKLILKPCENMMRDETNEKTNKNLMCKRKFQDLELEQAALGGEQIKKDPEGHLEADDAPPAKRHCVHDDFINGKMNAFKMLMKHAKLSQAKQSKGNSETLNRLK